MSRATRLGPNQHSQHHHHVDAALVVSAQSVVWTVAASVAAVYLGLRDHTAVLIAFGAIGAIDAIGSVALVHHFRHGLRRDELSDELERIAHRIVLVGLFSVGCAAVIGGLLRLRGGSASEASNAGIVLAAVSFVVLVALSIRKQRVARRISSNALLSDGHLSGIGAMQAAVTLAGTVVTREFGWRWADATATSVIGCVAVVLAVSTWRGEHRSHAQE